MNESRNQSSQTVFSVCTVLLVLYLYLGIIELIYSAFVLLGFSSFSTRLQLFFHLGWKSITNKIGDIISKLNLIILYFLFFYPYSLLKKLLYRPKKLNDSKFESLFETPDTEKYSNEYFEKPW